MEMERQMPRDNRMYHISEASNLRQFDKKLKQSTQSFAVFDSKIPTTETNRARSIKSKASEA